MFSFAIKREFLRLKSTRTRHLSTAAKGKEFFVVVWNHNSARQMTPPSHDVNFPTHTFEGDILDTAEAVTTVIGTTLVFNAESSDGVMDMLAGDPRSTQGIWDISTAVISPFETVLTSDLGKLIEAQSEIRESRILDPVSLNGGIGESNLKQANQLSTIAK